jgi:monothiol glutaredoxin
MHRRFDVREAAVTQRGDERRRLRRLAFRRQLVDQPKASGDNREAVADHPIADVPIRQLSAPELHTLIESGTPFELVDVRTDWERALARIDGSRLLDQAYHDALLAMDRHTPLVFQCHHGVRSQQAAEYFRREGFSNLSNLRGGIDAWSQLVDASIPRY